MENQLKEANGYSFHAAQNEFIPNDENITLSNEGKTALWSNIIELKDYNFLWKSDLVESSIMPPVVIVAIILGIFILCLLLGSVLLIWILRQRKIKQCYSGRIPKIFIWKRNEFHESQEFSSHRGSLPSIPPLHSSCNHPAVNDFSERDTWSLTAQWGSITTQDMQTNYPARCRSFSDSGTLKTPHAESQPNTTHHNTTLHCTTDTQVDVEQNAKTQDALFDASIKDGSGDSRKAIANCILSKEILLAKSSSLPLAGDYKDNTETPNILFNSSPVSSRVANPCTICTEVCDAMYEIASTLHAHLEIPGENSMLSGIPDASNTLQWGTNLPFQYASLMKRNDSFNKYENKMIFKEDNDEGYFQCHPAQLQNVMDFDDSGSHYDEHNESEKATQTTFVYPRHVGTAATNQNCNCKTITRSNQLHLPVSLNCKQCMGESNYDHETESCESILSLFSCFPDEATPIQCTNTNKDEVHCKSLQAEYSYGKS